jgi:thiol-disulfide isomerase/thioredoxin
MELLEPIEIDNNILFITNKHCKYCKEVYPIIEQYCNTKNILLYTTDINNFLFDEIYDEYKITKIPSIIYNNNVYIGKNSILSNFYI